MQEGSLACALWYRRAARFDVGERRRQPACQKSMKQTVQVGWGVDYGERSPTSLLMYGRRKSEGDPYVSQCCEITLILYAEMALGTDATRVRACTFVNRPMTILNQSPLALGLCKSALRSDGHRLPRLTRLWGIPFPLRNLMRLYLFETSSRVSRWCIRFALCVHKYNDWLSRHCASALRFAFAIG